MLEIRNCSRCGKIYNTTKNEKICKECEAKDEEDFRNVKQFLYENPGATISEIVGETGSSVGKIKKYLREERIEIINREGNLFLGCERCGIAINTGRFCKACSLDMSSELKGTADDMESRMFRENSDMKVVMRHLKDESSGTKPPKK